ncbi:MAG: GntR family transcriptional regulator [Halopseudomonas sabulinigri]
MTSHRPTSQPDSTDQPSASASGKAGSGKGVQRQDEIYRAISDAVIEHRLKPGARLREDALAEVFGISRTGIRKVLQRLALEQLVTLTPGKGASVTRPSAEEAREVFEARRLVESGLLAMLARRITADELKELRALAGEEQQALHEHEQSVAIKLSAAFHNRLAALAGNQTLARFVDQLCSRSSLILAVYGHAGNLGCECNDHNQLVDLLQAGESKQAATFMCRHLDSIEASLSIDDAPEEAPDLRDIFSAYQ